jgi:hypothetical protein
MNLPFAFMIESNNLTWWTKTFFECQVSHHCYVSLQFKPQNVKNVFGVNCVGHIATFDYASQNTIEWQLEECELVT